MVIGHDVLVTRELDAVGLRERTIAEPTAVLIERDEPVDGTEVAVFVGFRDDPPGDGAAVWVGVLNLLGGISHVLGVHVRPASGAADGVVLHFRAGVHDNVVASRVQSCAGAGRVDDVVRSSFAGEAVHVEDAMIGVERRLVFAGTVREADSHGAVVVGPRDGVHSDTGDTALGSVQKTGVFGVNSSLEVVACYTKALSVKVAVLILLKRGKRDDHVKAAARVQGIIGGFGHDGSKAQDFGYAFSEG